jgi:glycosyltransferase involved in cell wall biosynthesis
MSERPLRVVMLSKACYVAAYRTKLEAMAAIPGVELTLAVPPYWRFGRRREALEAGNDRGYEMVVLPPVLNGNHHLHFYPGFGRLLDRTRPDLIHIDEEPYDLVTVHALAAAGRRGIPVVFFTWQNLDVRYPPPFEWFRRWTLGRAAGAIAGNAEAAAILRRRGYRRTVEVVPQFGVDPEQFPFRPPRDGRPVSLGYAGRLWRGKGLDVLIEAAAGLRGDWRLDLVGEGDEAPTLRDQIDRLRLGERVRFLGGRPSAAMAAFYQTLDVLVLPSRTLPNWKEQFGRVLIEAMATGVAVVGSDSGEIPNVIGDAGWVVPEGDTVALRERLQWLVESFDLRAQAAERGRRRVLERFTQQHVAAATVAFYRGILGRATEGAHSATEPRPA